VLDKTTQSGSVRGYPIKTADTICSAPSHETPAHSAGVLLPSLPIPIQNIPSAPLPGKSRTARNTASTKPSRKRPKKRGRKKSKAWSLTSRYLRSHQPKRLKRTEVENLLKADHMAARIGQPLTTFITIRWAHTEQGESNINRRWSDLLNSFRIWASRHGFEWTAVGVHENPPSIEPAFNSHLLANIPESLRLAAAQWLVKQVGGKAGAIHTRPRTCRGWEADETLHYMLKGCDYLTAQYFSLIKKHGWKFDQGIVPFRRSTTTRNINATARREFSGAVKRGGPEFRHQYARTREGKAA
jgi:hypothetical protein